MWGDAKQEETALSRAGEGGINPGCVNVTT
jgi:hypothetical protein